MSEAELRNRMKRILMEKARIQGYGFSGGEWVEMGGSMRRRRKRKTKGGAISGGESALKEYNKLLKNYKKRIGYVPGSKEQLKEIRKRVSAIYQRDRGEI